MGIIRYNRACEECNSPETIELLGELDNLLKDYKLKYGKYDLFNSPEDEVNLKRLRRI